jgi:ribosomal protein S12 methylthiotransferase accessory factor
MTSPPAELRSLCRQFGVTRLARVTGLDGTGIEVVAAIRPWGHVLQVSQGKGRTLEQARWSALGEAAELAAAETVDPSRLVWRTDGDGLRAAWVEGTDLSSGRPAWVPAQAVFCPKAGGVWLGPISTTWTSNGLAFHPHSRTRAVAHAVLELLERHVLAEVLPEGWTSDAVARRLVAPPPLAKRLGASGFGAFVFDVSLSSRSIPVAAALLFDASGGPVPLTAGYACRRRFEDAAEAALLEAAQSRLTEIHGAREDVLGGAREDGRMLGAELERLRPRRRPPRPWAGTLADAVPAPVTVVTLSRAPWVVKVVSPKMARSELL